AEVLDLAGQHHAGVHGGRADIGIVGVDIGAVDAALSRARYPEYADGAVLPAEIDEVAAIGKAVHLIGKGNARKGGEDNAGKDGDCGAEPAPAKAIAHAERGVLQTHRHEIPPDNGWLGVLARRAQRAI